jgi:hypothetical protein
MRGKGIYARRSATGPATAVNDEVARTFATGLESIRLEDVPLQFTISNFL